MSKDEAIIITGTPGVGKSEVARALSKITGRKVIDLNSLAKSSRGIRWRDASRDTAIVNTKALRKALRSEIKEDQQVIIEGHLADLVPDEFVRIAIVLRCHPIVLMERLGRRGYSKGKIRENAEAELLDSCLIAAMESFGGKVREIDTTGRDVEDVARESARALDGLGGQQPGCVNWISVLEGEGRLLDLIR